MGTLKRALVIAACAAACGCNGSSDSGPTPSSDLAANVIQLSASVRGNGSLVQATANLTGPEYDAVETTGGDRLLLTCGGVEAEMVFFDNLYAGQVASGDTECAVVFERADGARITSDYPLPPPFVLVAPADPVSLSAPFTFTWDAGSGDYDTVIAVWSPCFADIKRALTTDTGTYTIQPADLANLTPGSACDIAVEITRTWTHASNSGSLAAVTQPATAQVRTIRFPATP